MFTRTHRIGHYDYLEVLESYRDVDNGRPKHRCVARWRAGRSLAEELGRTRFDVGFCRKFSEETGKNRQGGLNHPASE